MKDHDAKDDGSVRLVVVVLISSLLMLVWFYFHPLTAIICSTFALVVSIIAIWPPQLRTDASLSHKSGA